jgi:hypothetical protein
VPLRQVEDIAAQISTWLRTSFELFLSAETVCLIDIDNLGEFKVHAIERFREMLHKTVKNSLKTDSPMMPEWTADRVREAWNVY